MRGMVRKKVDEWLKDVCYKEDPDYTPSKFALGFVAFIKLVNGADGEEHLTPVIHMKMLDNILGSNFKNELDIINQVIVYNQSKYKENHNHIQSLFIIDSSQSSFNI